MTSITLYWAQWCPHCIEFKPTWSKIKQWCAKNNVSCNEYEDMQLQVERKKGNRNIPFQLIEGFPTILIYKNRTYHKVTNRDPKNIINMLGGTSAGTAKAPSATKTPSRTGGGRCTSNYCMI